MHLRVFLRRPSDAPDARARTRTTAPKPGRRCGSDHMTAAEPGRMPDWRARTPSCPGRIRDSAPGSTSARGRRPTLRSEAPSSRVRTASRRPSCPSARGWILRSPARNVFCLAFIPLPTPKVTIGARADADLARQQGERPGWRALRVHERRVRPGWDGGLARQPGIRPGWDGAPGFRAPHPPGLGWRAGVSSAASARVGMALRAANRRHRARALRSR